MVYLLRVRSSGWSLRIILQHGGGGARRTRPLAPPPPCWRLILLDTQAQQYGGGCEVEERGRGGFDLRIRSQCTRLWWGIPRTTLPPPFSWNSVPSTLLVPPQKAQRQPPHVAAHLWRREPFLNHTDLCWIADFVFFFCFRFCLFSSQAANWYASHVKIPPRANFRAGGRARKKRRGKKQSKEGSKERKSVGKAEFFGSQWQF